MVQPFCYDAGIFILSGNLGPSLSSERRWLEYQLAWLAVGVHIEVADALELIVLQSLALASDGSTNPFTSSASRVQQLAEILLLLLPKRFSTLNRRS